MRRRNKPIPRLKRIPGRFRPGHFRWIKGWKALMKKEWEIPVFLGFEYSDDESQTEKEADYIQYDEWKIIK